MTRPNAIAPPRMRSKVTSASSEPFEETYGHGRRGEEAGGERDIENVKHGCSFCQERLN